MLSVIAYGAGCWDLRRVISGQSASHTPRPSQNRWRGESLYGSEGVTSSAATTTAEMTLGTASTLHRSALGDT
jgi:hypothetical protein